ncbi:hypothetical protein AA0483_1145 [Acetobacter syzygii NRIC 0483]|nr:hypothetical protein AA0483_1145 [Acetobacter syzygii NRIC 0483]
MVNNNSSRAVYKELNIISEAGARATLDICFILKQADKIEKYFFYFFYTPYKISSKILKIHNNFGKY